VPVAKKNTAYRRRWANIVVAAAGAYSLAAAAQLPVELGTGDAGETVRFEMWIPIAHTLAGVLGMASLFVAIRWPRFARIPLIAAALLLLSGFLALHRITLLPALSLGLPALAMVGAIPFMGTMPSPQEEAAEEAAHQGPEQRREPGPRADDARERRHRR